MASHPPSRLCPAKINLFLEVGEKRPDGFHALGTLFQALDIGDTLSAEPWDRIEIVGDAVPGRPEDNLVHRAAALLQSRFPGPVRGQGIRFRLEKRIPMGAGLGGGSSDAAAALSLANGIWGLNLSREELRALAPELGSDVAFFLYQPTAFAEGRGEDLSPAPEPYPFHVVIATPPCRVETAWAYRQMPDRSSGNRWRDFKARYAAEAGNPAFYSRLHNDFEEIVAAKFPETRALRDALLGFSPEKAMLTGSGSSLFALFREPEKAQACLAAVAPRCRFSAVARFAMISGVG